MSSVQERLQLKRVPLDNWTVKEKLCLASAVACSGDQNWMYVSRTLKMLCPSNRPSDWFSQKSCAAQYGKLLENFDTPKRKKRTEKDSTGETETPSDVILRKLTQERIVELKKMITEEQQQYSKLKDDVDAVPATNDEEKLHEMWNQIELDSKQKDKENLQNSLWLKAREERKLELEKAWRPGLGGSSPKTPLTLKIKPEDMDIDESCSGSQSQTSPLKHGTSPLLTSLLKSPSPAPTTSTTAATTPNTSSIVRNLLGSKPKPTGETSSSTFPAIGSQVSAAPTLSLLLESPSQTRNDDSAIKTDSIDFRDLTEESPSSIDNDQSKDDDQLMDVFNGLIPDDIDEFADILTDNNAIILSPELLEGEEEESILENVDSLIADQEKSENERRVAEMEDVKVLADLKSDSSSSSASEVMKSEVEESDTLQAPKNDKEAAMMNNTPEVKEELPQNDDDESVGNDIVPKNEESFGNESSNDVVEVVKKEENEIHDDDVKDEIKNEEVTQTPPASVEELLPVETEKVDEVKTEDDDDDVIMTSEDLKPEVTDDKTIASETIKEEKPKSILEAEKTPIEIINLEDASPEAPVEKEAEKTPEASLNAGDSENDEDEDENKTISAIKEEEAKYTTPTIEIKSNESSVDQKMSSDDEEEEEEETYEDAKDFDEELTKVPDAQQQQQQQQPMEQTTPICITDTDEESPCDSSVKDEPKTKRDYTRKKSSTESAASSSSQPPKVEESLPAIALDDNKSNLSIRMKLKERDRSESPLVLDDDNDETPRTRRRYSSTPNIDSVPNSPASSDDREFRAWKKNLYNTYMRLTSHKHANLFLKIDENFANYKSMVLRPIDLIGLKKNVDAGISKTTAEFQRDVMLMCNNLIMILPRNSPEISCIQEFRQDAISTIEQTMMEGGGWKKEELKTTPIVVSAAAVGVSSLNKVRGGRKSSRMSNI